MNSEKYIIHNNYDVIIIGAGIAGLSNAIVAYEKGLNVLILSKGNTLGLTNTSKAQGGIVGSLLDNVKDDTLKSDIIFAGAGVNNEQAVDLVVNKGCSYVQSFLIDKIKVPFDKNENGKFHLTREASHSEKRIYHVKDTTGKSIEEYLIKYINNHCQDMTIMVNSQAIELLKDHKNNTINGVRIFNHQTHKTNIIESPQIVLATGGLGSIYGTTSNIKQSYGDGIALAYNIGVDLKDMEYVQFHPTVYKSKLGEGFLISEAMRGEGAILEDHNNFRFMKNYEPKQLDLAPRDKVARAIFHETQKISDDHMYLRATHMDSAFLKNHFKNIYNTCLKDGIDITTDRIPISPSAHFLCGGIKVDSCGRTNIKGLFAIGEVSCTGLHGANRLASTSLLECLTWGIECAKILKKESLENHLDENNIRMYNIDINQKYQKFDEILSTIKHELRNNVFIIRTEENLQKTFDVFIELKQKLNDIHDDTNYDIIYLESILSVATIITENALKNKESKGCHFIN